MKKWVESPSTKKKKNTFTSSNMRCATYSKFSLFHLWQNGALFLSWKLGNQNFPLTNYRRNVIYVKRIGKKSNKLQCGCISPTSIHIERLDFFPIRAVVGGCVCGGVLKKRESESETSLPLSHTVTHSVWVWKNEKENRKKEKTIVIIRCCWSSRVVVK